MYSYFCVVEYSVIIANMIYQLSAPPMMEFPINFVKKFVLRNSEQRPNNGTIEEKAELLAE